MTHAPIPADIRRFIAEHIHSVAEMEALVMLVQHPQTAWDAELAARRLYIPPPEAQAVLQKLAQSRLAERCGAQFHNGLAASPHAATAEALVALYSQQLIAVTHLIHSHRPSRVQEFADAFRLRKKD